VQKTRILLAFFGHFSYLYMKRAEARGGAQKPNFVTPRVTPWVMFRPNEAT